MPLTLGNAQFSAGAAMLDWSCMGPLQLRGHCSSVLRHLCMHNPMCAVCSSGCNAVDSQLNATLPVSPFFPTLLVKALCNRI